MNRVSVQNKPEVARYITEWQQANEGKTFEFSNSSDQAEFLRSLADMAQHIAHTSRKARVFTITSKDGVSTVYVNVES